MYNWIIMLYASDLTLRDARTTFFRLSDFPPDGGYDDRWIKVKYLRFPVWLPNVENRRRAVPLHDLHHILTEYPTTWRGEAEISAWEVASGGLHGFWAAWILDLMNIAQGLLINPSGVYAAFMRGRGSRNLYGQPLTDQLLDSSIGEVRSRLHLDEQGREPDVRDHAALAFWTLAGVLTYLAAVLAPCLIVAIVIGWIFFR